MLCEKGARPTLSFVSVRLFSNIPVQGDTIVPVLQVLMLGAFIYILRVTAIYLYIFMV